MIKTLYTIEKLPEIQKEEHFMLDAFSIALSRKTEMPLHAFYLCHEDERGLTSNSTKLQKHILFVGLSDEESNIYRPDMTAPSRRKNLLEQIKIVSEWAFESEKEAALYFKNGGIISDSPLSESTFNTLCSKPHENQIEKILTETDWTDYKTLSQPSGFKNIHGYLEKYTQRDCYYYAEALARTLGLPGVAIKMTGGYGDSDETGWHAAVIHPDGHLEDIWGKRTLKSIGRLYDAKTIQVLTDPYALNIWTLKQKLGQRIYEKRVIQAMRVVKINPSYSNNR